MTACLPSRQPPWGSWPGVMYYTYDCCTLLLRRGLTFPLQYPHTPHIKSNPTQNMYSKVRKACDASYWNVRDDGDCGKHLMDLQVGAGGAESDKTSSGDLS